MVLLKTDKKERLADNWKDYPGVQICNVGQLRQFFPYQEKHPLKKIY